MMYKIIVLLLILQACKTPPPSPTPIFSGNTAAKDTLEYKALLHKKQVELFNMYEVDSNKSLMYNSKDSYVYSLTLVRYLFVDSLMHMEKYRREYNSEYYINTMLSYFYEDKLYSKVQKKHQVQLLSIQDSPNQLYQDTISQIMKVVIDGDTFEYQAYLVKQPFIDIPLEEQKWQTPRWDFKIPFSIDLFWDLYKDEPLVCELLARNFSTLTNSIYRRGHYYYNWLIRMVNYQNSEYAKDELCYYIELKKREIGQIDYSQVDSSFMEKLKAGVPTQFNTEEEYRNCADSLWAYKMRYGNQE